jgi:AcrR family transcriptional regulator
MGITERKEREKEARREVIISAAEKVFNEKGLVAATMDDIAEAAELSKGTLYLYYRSREDLYLAVTLRGMEVMCGLFQGAVSTGESPIKHIQNLGEAYYQFFRDYRNYFRMLYFFESPGFQEQISPSMHEQCNAVDKKVWDIVVAVIRKGINEGLLHEDLDPLETGIMLWSNLNGFLRLIDRNEAYWKALMGIDLEKTLRKASALLVEAMMTEKAQKMFPELILYHGQTHKTTSESQNP